MGSTPKIFDRIGNTPRLEDQRTENRPKDCILRGNSIPVAPVGYVKRRPRQSVARPSFCDEIAFFTVPKGLAVKDSKGQPRRFYLFHQDGQAIDIADCLLSGDKGHTGNIAPKTAHIAHLNAGPVLPASHAVQQFIQGLFRAVGSNAGGWGQSDQHPRPGHRQIDRCG